MNCECIPSIEKRMLTTFNEDNRYKVKIESVSIDNKTLILNRELISMKLQTYTEVTILLANGRKRRENLIHRYCPFCGRLEAEHPDE